MTRARDVADRAVITTADLVNIPSGAKNLIINGDMRIAQRGTSVSGLQNSPSYLVDRWSYRRTATWSTASFTYSQISSTGLAYFDNAARLTVTGSETPSSNTFASIDQNIEGLNIAHLNWGTADAKTVTISFWVRSSLTGTFSGYTSSTTADQTFVFEYTISSANTWEKKTITISGPTLGTWFVNNNVGIRFGFAISGDTSGSYATSTIGSWQSNDVRYSTNQTNLAGTSGATFDLTGVQLEVGTEATSFEHRPYDMELQRCQRYYELCYGGGYVGDSSTNFFFGFGSNFRVQKRAVPALTRISDVGAANVNTPYSENISIYGFRSMAQATNANANWSTTYSAEAEL